MKTIYKLASVSALIAVLANCTGGDKNHKMSGSNGSAGNKSTEEANSEDAIKTEEAKTDQQKASGETESTTAAPVANVEFKTDTTSGGAIAGDDPTKKDPTLVATTSVGIKSAPQIYSSYLAITGAAPSAATTAQFEALKNALPQFSNKLVSFDASQQSAIVKLALNVCNDLVDSATAAPAFFPGFDFNKVPSALTDADKAIIAKSLSTRFWGSNLKTGMDAAAKEAQISTLLTELIAGLANKGTAQNTKNVVKGVCSSVAASLETILL
jgi:hypothetical protein